MIVQLNVLSLLAVFFSFVFQVLFLRKYGAVLATDQYYLVIGIIFFISSIINGLLTDLYIPVYKSLPEEGKERPMLTGALLVLSLIISLSAVILIEAIPGIFVKIFASGIKGKGATEAVTLLRITAPSLIFIFVNNIFMLTLNTHMYFILPYSLRLLPPLSNILTLLFLAQRFGVKVILVGFVLSQFITFIIYIIYSPGRIDITLNNPFSNNQLKRLLAKNLPIRSGNILYLLKDPLTLNFLSYLGEGSITIFNFAQKIYMIIQNTLQLPYISTFFVKISRFISEKKDKESISKLFRETLTTTTIMLAITYTITILLFKPVIIPLLGSNFGANQFRLLFNTFLCLSPFFMVFSIELPASRTTFALQKSFVVLRIAVIFIISYFILLRFPLWSRSIYTIPIALLIAQSINTIQYYWISYKYGIKVPPLDIIIPFSFILFLTIVGFLTYTHQLFFYVLTAISSLLFYLVFKKQLINAFNVITRTGEIR